MPTITSPQNDHIKLIRTLQSRPKARRKTQRLALEGLRLVGDALAAGALADFAIYTPDFAAGSGSALLDTLRARGAVCFEVTPQVMAHAAQTQTPQGIIAVLSMPELPVRTPLTLALILDGVADPGNIGTILRTAAAAGVDVVDLAPGCADPYNPKALRAGMGAHFRVPIAHRAWGAIVREFAALEVYLADAHGARPYDAVDWVKPSALIIGGEASGAAQEARKFAAQSVFIPMANAAESLNAAAAAAVILFEIRRQRSS